MARSTRLMILIKNIYTLWGRKRFLLPVTYFPTNLVYPFTLRVTGIKSGLSTNVKYIKKVMEFMEHKQGQNNYFSDYISYVHN